MPIDPNIALSVRPPQIESYTDAYAKAQQVQSQQQQQMLGAQQLAQGGMQLQQQQMDFEDQRKMRQAWMDSNGDPQQMFKLAVKYGVGPKTLMTTQKALLDQATARATLTEKENTNQQSHNDLLNGLIQPVLAETDPLKQQAAWNQQMQEGIRRGVIKPEEAQQHPYPGSPDGVKQYAASLATDKWLTAQAALQRGTAAQTQANNSTTRLTTELPGIETANKLKAQDLADKQRIDAATQLAGAAGQLDYQAKRGALPYQIAKLFPEQFDKEAVLKIGMTPDQQAIVSGQAAGRAETARHDAATEKATATGQAETGRHNRIEEGQGAARVGIERQGVAIRAAEADPYGQMGINPHPIGDGKAANLTGDDFLSTLPPSLAARVKAVATGRDIMPTGRAANSGPGKAIVDAVYRYDPSFTTQRAQIRKAFTTGNDGRNIGALNTATVHLDQLAEAAKAMSNGSFVPGNEIWNRVQAMFGGNAPTNFQALQAAVNGEMANALKGQATDPEIANIAKTTRQAGSPAQIAGAIETHLHTLGAKLNTYQERYQQQIPNDNWSPVLPSARTVYQKHGINPTAGPAANAGGTNNAGKITVKAGDGSLHPFDTDAQAKAFEDLVEKVGGTTSRVK